MRQSYKIIPVYTADVSGVCSALYELGGMVVMHDPSGCNSTYNTHDEIRWYDKDSLIYISGLSEIDAVMGNDAKFINDIEEAARELKPEFIALAGSPIPFMNGTDFPAIAQVIQTETGIPSFAIPTNGMHDYTYGAGLALAEIAERFVRESETVVTEEKSFFRDGSPSSAETERIHFHTLNILGATPLDFGPQQNVDAMKQRLKEYGWEVLSTWAMGDSLEDLSRAGKAEVNLVVSSVGLPTARVLEEKIGTSYVIGTPIGGFTEELIQALNEKTQYKNRQLPEKQTDTKQKAPYLQKRLQSPPEITIIGEAVTMGSLAASIEKKYHRAVRVICPLETQGGLLGENDCTARGEEEMEELLKGAGIILADPLYRPICPRNARFYELPHIAFSGRIFLKDIENTKKYIAKQNFWWYDEENIERRNLS